MVRDQLGRSVTYFRYASRFEVWLGSFVTADCSSFVPSWCQLGRFVTAAWLVCLPISLFWCLLTVVGAFGDYGLFLFACLLVLVGVVCD